MEFIIVCLSISLVVSTLLCVVLVEKLKSDKKEFKNSPELSMLPKRVPIQFKTFFWEVMDEYEKLCPKIKEDLELYYENAGQEPGLLESQKIVENRLKNESETLHNQILLFLNFADHLTNGLLEEKQDDLEELQKKIKILKKEIPIEDFLDKIKTSKELYLVSLAVSIRDLIELDNDQQYKAEHIILKEENRILKEEIRSLRERIIQFGYLEDDL